MSYEAKLKEATDWLYRVGLRKEAVELLALLSKNANDDDLYAAIRKLRIERARMVAVGKSFRGR